jgi:hypothetical protein
MIQKAVMTAGVVIVLFAASSVYTWIEVPANTRQVQQASAEAMGILHVILAVILVSFASVLTLAAVRGVSSRRVIRVYPGHEGDYEPPLPCHKPEPEPEEDAWTTLPAARQAAAITLPGRASAPTAPEPDFREVPR